jgi:hypothetical protein
LLDWGGRNSSTTTQTSTHHRCSPRPNANSPQATATDHKPHKPGKTESRNTTASRWHPPQPTTQLQNHPQIHLRRSPRPTNDHKQPHQCITTSKAPHFHQGRCRSHESPRPLPWRSSLERAASHQGGLLHRTVPRRIPRHGGRQHHRIGARHPHRRRHRIHAMRITGKATTPPHVGQSSSNERATRSILH